jgi:hypothetical protein
VLGADEDMAPNTLDYSGKTTGITLMTDGTERTVQLASSGSLFTVNSGITLTLGNNVTLKGRENNNSSLVKITASSVFVLNGGNISSNIVPNGGTISGNTAASGDEVYVSSGTFEMNGGTISGNTASYGGGGVYGISSGTFTKSSTGGVITGYGGDTATGNKVVVDGVVQSNEGHAVYINASPVTRLKNTIVATKALDNGVSGAEGGWTE